MPRPQHTPQPAYDLHPPLSSGASAGPPFLVHGSPAPVSGCSQAGEPQGQEAFCLCRDIFSLGFGPFRWVCTSGDPQDLAVTDELATSVLEEAIADGGEAVAWEMLTGRWPSKGLGSSPPPDAAPFSAHPLPGPRRHESMWPRVYACRQYFRFFAAVCCAPLCLPCVRAPAVACGFSERERGSAFPRGWWWLSPDGRPASAPCLTSVPSCVVDLTCCLSRGEEEASI